MSNWKMCFSSFDNAILVHFLSFDSFTSVYFIQIEMLSIKRIAVFISRENCIYNHYTCELLVVLLFVTKLSDIYYISHLTGSLISSDLCSLFRATRDG